jgi:hypothetical protein
MMSLLFKTVIVVGMITVLLLLAWIGYTLLFLYAAFGKDGRFHAKCLKCYKQLDRWLDDEEWKED